MHTHSHTLIHTYATLHTICFELESHGVALASLELAYVVQVSLKFTGILQPLPPEWWDRRCTPLCLTTQN